MRFTRTIGSSVVALALALSAAPAPAAEIGTQRWALDDRPACPVGQTAVWVDHDEVLPQLYVDPMTREITFSAGQQESHGWECQPIRLRVVGP